MMKRTHLSVGVYDRYFGGSTLRKPREHHKTSCGTTCDVTKATTDPARVTCLMCKRRAVTGHGAIPLTCTECGSINVHQHFPNCSRRA